MSRDWQIGDHIQNRWEIHKILHGGMGTVYVVYDHEHPNAYAAKTFQDEIFARYPAIAERFAQEALTWVNLDAHQNIAQARFVETINGKFDLFMISWQLSHTVSRIKQHATCKGSQRKGKDGNRSKILGGCNPRKGQYLSYCRDRDLFPNNPFFSEFPSAGETRRGLQDRSQIHISTPTIAVMCDGRSRLVLS